MQALNLPSYDVKIENRDNKDFIWDFVRKKYVRLTKEEWVRQHFLNLLVSHKGFPISLIGVEKQIIVNNMEKRFDILVFNSDAKPQVIVECKSPEITISQNTFMQASNYNTVLKAPYLIITNGIEHHVAEINFSLNSIRFLESIPNYIDIKSPAL